MQGLRDVPKWALRSLGVVGCVFAVGALGACESTTTSDGNEQSNASASSGDCGRTASEDCTPHVGPNGSVRVDALVWRVESARTTPTIGEQQYGLGEKANGVFIVADLSVTSKKDESATVSDDVIKLVVDGGNTYSADSDGTFAAMTDGREPLFLTDIGPDSTLTAPVVFDVPTSVIGKKLELSFSELGFGSSQGFIRLPPL
jgi:hypothetical protein